MTKVAILDDYQHVAQSYADWSVLPPDSSLTYFHDHLADEGELVERLGDFEVVVAMRERTPFPAGLLARLPNLRLLVTTGMRNASIDVDAAARQGITVTGTDGVATSTPELTWALILAVARHVPAEDANVRAGGWQQTVGFDLAGKRLGVLGLGRIGTQVARVGQAFGMEVTAWSQNLTAEAAGQVGVTRVEKDRLFAESDVLTIHLVLSERTRGLVTAADLARMQPSAYLVNTSRGPIVDEAALLAALREGAIAGAGIDVFDTEPLPPDHPLRTLPNTVVTPHLGYVTDRAYRIFYGQAAEDIAGFLAGTPVRVLRAPDPAS
jgi:phosphoglycerate dehydrogenase-like enzyme